MKKFTLLMLMLFVCLWAGAQSKLPDFSTEDEPVWYTVQFKTGSAYLSDVGANSKMVTVASASTTSQQFQFIGTQSEFVMKSKAGRYVAYNGSYFTTTKSSSSAEKLAIIKGSANNYFEIQRTASPSNAMNQWAGTGAGKNLGEWSTGDDNNQLYFNMVGVKWPTFSTDDTEKYYFVKFNRASRYMAESTNGTDNCIRLYSVDDVDGQKWKLVGTKDNFQFVNKSGNIIAVSSTSISTTEGGTNPNPLRYGTTEQSGGFKLVESTNTTNGSGFEIVANSKSGNNYVNMWGSVVEGNTLGFWQAGDQNNVCTFVDPDDMDYADYKSTGIEGYVPENALTLWYTEPATTAKLYSGGQGYSNWMEYSLPIGDGQFGASLFGGMYKDEIQFNEKTLWSGTAAKSASGGSGYGKYENFGSVFAEDLSGEFSTTASKAAKDYYRQLDLTTATGKTQFTSQSGVTYTREYIASNPARVVAAHYTASEKGKISLRFTLEPGYALKKSAAYADGEGYFSGKLDLVSFNARMKVVPTGGTIETTDEGVTVTGADEVLLLLAGGTDYDAYASTYISNTAALSSTIEARLNDAEKKGWSELLAEHVADHQKYFSRVDFQLDGTKNEVPTNKLIDTYSSGKGTNALMLEQLYFAYGRYLEIASSRGVDLPSNLQGIWSNMVNPAWNADIHSNINVQMNYWPAEPTNLSEMHVPFLHYIWNEAENHSEWQKWAKNSGQSRGWTCYTENNIFGGVSSFMTNYVIANAWYASHLWQHYRYTLDKDYLKKVFPAMLSASQFWMDRLEKADDGTYEAPNEWSPEHGPSAEDGVAHAQQLVYDLFSNTLAAIDVLGDDANVSDDDLDKLKDRFANLDNGLHTETYTGNWGTDRIAKNTPILREWKYSSYTATTEGVNHRHMSHLMCLYPFSQVHPGTALYDAAVNSLRLRGDGATGWSMGWKINLWARALDGDHARTILNNALSHSNGGAGVFYNLFDAHAPFQIDGNFGACAGIAEMIMQSNADTIRILPALPSAWKAGHMNGMKAVKDFTVSTTWAKGEATRVTIVNNQGQTIPVLYKNLAKAKVYVDGKLTTLAVDENGVANLSGEAGTTYVFDFDGTYTPTGIQTASDNALRVNVEGRRVSLDGKDLKQVRVVDLSGRTLQKTSRSSFTVDRAAGHSFVIEATDKDGHVTTQKVVLK